MKKISFKIYEHIFNLFVLSVKLSTLSLKIWAELHNVYPAKILLVQNSVDLLKLFTDVQIPCACNIPAKFQTVF